MPESLATRASRPSTPQAPAGAASRGEAVVLLCPPWPAGGSSNVFAAQVAAHRRLGRDVLVLVVAHEASHDVSSPAWRSRVSGAFAEVLGGASAPPVSFCLRPAGSRAPEPAERDDPISARHRFASQGVPDDVFVDFVASHDVGLVHVNHVYSMGVGLAVARCCRRPFRRAPPVVCETHDVQSHGMVAQGLVRPEDERALLAGEVAILSDADRLIHITARDAAFFSACLPGLDHRVVPGTLRPATESALRASRGGVAEGGPDLLYVGDRHMGNVATLRELLGEVMPRVLARRPGTTLSVAGDVGSLVAAVDPVLHAAWSASFVGRVPDLVPLYASAGCVYAASRASTGSSIKLVEALCSGRPVAVNAEGLRGLGDGDQGPGLFVSEEDGPAAMARAVLDALDPFLSAGAGSSNAAVYERLFSGRAYGRAFAAAVAPASSRRAPRPPLLADLRALASGWPRPSLGAPFPP